MRQPQDGRYSCDFALANRHASEHCGGWFRGTTCNGRVHTSCCFCQYSAARFWFATPACAAAAAKAQKLKKASLFAANLWLWQAQARFWLEARVLGQSWPRLWPTTPTSWSQTCAWELGLWLISLLPAGGSCRISGVSAYAFRDDKAISGWPSCFACRFCHDATGHHLAELLVRLQTGTCVHAC